MTSTWRILAGDVRETLATLPEASVQCVVTSPPYWGLRDYGVDGQIGLEMSPYAYVDAMVAVFEDVRRVLRDDGVLWLNLGDCYATGAGSVGNAPGGGAQGARWRGDVDRLRDDKRGYRGARNGHEGKHGYGGAGAGVGPMTQPNRMPIEGLKPKDLVGIPWRVAFALQAAGWYLRSDVIWSKPNPMPESIKDRPTKSHEYLFLLTKSERYHYDAAAIAEPASEAMAAQMKRAYTGEALKDYEGAGVQNPSDVKRRIIAGKSGNKERSFRGDHGGVQDGSRSHQGFGVPWEGLTRNRRSVWTITTQPYREAHFATFPEALVEPCILAGSRPGDLVLDPFAGSGTTGAVAIRHQRSFVGCELNPEYRELARRRIGAVAPMFATEVAS